MKKKICGIIVAMVVLGAILLYVNPVLNYRNSQLQDALETLSYNKGVTLEEAIPFEWDYVYRFAPYTTKADMENKMGVTSRHVTEAKSDEIMQVYVVKNDKIVACYSDRMDSEIIEKLPEKVKYGEKFQ